MNISEFTTRVLNKLFITEQDAKQFGYDSKIIPTLNECLTFIANDVLANRVTIPFDVAYDTSGYLPECLLPSDVLSVLFVDTDVPGATYYQPTRRTIRFNYPGKYLVICDALYPKIETGDIEHNCETIPESVMTCAVLYVAAQLMRDIDLTTAITIQNEYETAIARLDNGISDLQESFRFVPKW